MWRDLFPKQKKIAVVGRYPYTMDLAPYANPDWQIWVCNGAASTGQAPRYDVCFDPHEYPWDPADEGNAFHRDWMRAQEKPIVLKHLRGECPNEVRLPVDQLLESFGRRNFPSTISYMLGMAILMAPEEIGAWGVEMAAETEYVHQRASCCWLLGIAEGRGIRVTLPEQCGLLTAPLYCYDWGQNG